MRPRYSYDEGRLYDVKEEIYRLPDRLLYGLAMYYGLLPESGWDAVDKLLDKGVISAEAVPHLQYRAPPPAIMPVPGAAGFNSTEPPPSS